tara:strand:+ start:2752 stop:2973 length:222 start_codon:yes stop_codon:yes gene_type:complete
MSSLVFHSICNCTEPKLSKVSIPPEPSKTTVTEPSSLISQPVSLSDHFAFHFDKSVPSNNTTASSGGAESEIE